MTRTLPQRIIAVVLCIALALLIASTMLVQQSNAASAAALGVAALIALLISMGVTFATAESARSAASGMLADDPLVAQGIEGLIASADGSTLVFGREASDIMAGLSDRFYETFPEESGVASFGATVMPVGHPGNLDATNIDTRYCYPEPFVSVPRYETVPLDIEEVIDRDGWLASLNAAYSNPSNDYSFDTISLSYGSPSTNTIPTSYSNKIAVPADLYFAKPYIVKKSATLHSFDGVNYYFCQAYYPYYYVNHPLYDNSINTNQPFAITTSFYYNAALYDAGYGIVLGGIPVEYWRTGAIPSAYEKWKEAIAERELTLDLEAVGAMDIALDGTGALTLTQDKVLTAAGVKEEAGTDDPKPTPPPEGENPFGGYSFINKFPFCVPFDLVALVEALGQRAEVPVWEIPVNMEFAGYSGVVRIDLSEFEEAAAVIRTGITLLWILGLILITRKIIQG